jgi:hypothetical protein
MNSSNDDDDADRDGDGDDDDDDDDGCGGGGGDNNDDDPFTNKRQTISRAVSNIQRRKARAWSTPERSP